MRIAPAFISSRAWLLSSGCRLAPLHASVTTKTLYPRCRASRVQVFHAIICGESGDIEFCDLRFEVCQPRGFMMTIVEESAVAVDRLVRSFIEHFGDFFVFSCGAKSAPRVSCTQWTGHRICSMLPSMIFSPGVFLWFAAKLEWSLGCQSFVAMMKSEEIGRAGCR